MADPATGKVTKAFGNLVHVAFKGAVLQGEVAHIHVKGVDLRGEVIEIAGSDAKIQVFEETRGVQFGTPVTFNGYLLEAELGPGLLGSIVDGLQNPLERVADREGLLLTRGIYLPCIDTARHWDYHPLSLVGSRLRGGGSLRRAVLVSL